ncbi:hypothetical protein RM697_09895 [Ichthyenterobacterium sp. W332]|uniref:TonB C-terminal domain-containing protein n=1 Tax=Microcosmobacter mediterraneus TaxID=3075607 RepID=A0ABU2YMB6_9FLAO|nr:hypothetical protein [Ichthyenterobacterium sp. W332]MDT0558960.1 hypothetical protein [Ichthyenterobacterium sp. W332]
MKRLGSLLFLFMVLNSCQYFEKKKVYSQDIYEEELKTINWNDVDQYPAFENCESVTIKQDRKQCFETTLTQYINTYFSNQNIIVSHDINDTLYLKLEIDKAGTIDVYSIEADSLTRAHIPKLDSLVERNILALPKIYPAIKRGQEVNTEFLLPIVIKLD